jgi:carboxyl-terminal processing protease
MTARGLQLGAILTLALLAGCRAAPANQPAVTATPRSLAGDPVGDAFNILLQQTAGQVDETKVAEAGVQGLRLAVISAGVVPAEVPVPDFTGDQAQDLVLLRSAVQATTNHYGSKLGLAQADDAVIASMAQSIDDCHTAYFTPEQFRIQQAWITGQMQFGGIGASLRKPKASDPLIIWRVFSGTPAEKAGLKDGDVIAEVDGRDVSTMTVQTVVDLIRGPVGQPVRLTVLSGASATRHSITVVRAQIQPPSVEFRMLEAKIGYVQIYGFPANLASQVKGALDALDRQGAVSLIVDVRDNGGGALDAVTQVVSMFVPKGTLLYYMYDAAGKRTDFVADGSARSHQIPVVILTNDGTGSGSEMFAAVLREQASARIVGGTTAGCVGTGEVFPIAGGGGLQVTVARMLTGRGKILNRVGVTPDIVVDLPYQDLVKNQDPQLQAAIKLVQTGG